jgi:hypothetical protein
MKKFLYGCLIVLIAAVVSVAANVALSSCENPVIKGPTVKTADIQNCLDSIVNPILDSFDGAYELQQELASNAFIDSVYCSLDKETLKNVYTVVSKKLHYVTKGDVVGEFLKNRQIYDNLPPPDNDASNATSSTTIKTEESTAIPGIVKEGTTTVTEAPPTRAVESEPAGSYRDTTINGKHALIKN